MALLEHQARAVAKLQDNEKGLLVYHSMGAGKTLTALTALALSPGKKIVIAPASVLNVYNDESAKHHIPIENTEIYSYEKFQRLPKSDNRYSLAVIDEAHRLRNPDTDIRTAVKALMLRTDKVLFLSGTAEYNQPVDICNLISLLDPHLGFPDNMTDFEEKYVNEKGSGLKNKDELCSKLAKYIDIYDAPKSDDYPAAEEKTIKIEMSKKQTAIYKFLESKIPLYIRKYIQANIPMAVKNNAKLNAFSSAIRQASDSLFKYDPNTKTEDCTKLLAAAHEMEKRASEPYFRGILYSNYIKAGIMPYSEILKQEGIEHAVYIGNTPGKEKIKIVEEYNSPDPAPKIILVSSTGSEGLDLKGTSLIQILEPHFNFAKIDQMIHRGIRYKSHSHLPKGKRKVQIERYLSVMPLRWYHKLFGMHPKASIDEYLYDMSKRKQSLMDELKAGVAFYQNIQHRANI